ncbi:MAG: PrsW family intramembrane metalloprotease [Firmicutes bacterium]|nr:PrsW family intramembrane metalloprotease [Bacillota bacterium]
MYYGTNPILMISAILPAIILMVQVYRADKLEKEPIRLLIALAFLGIISTIIAVVLEMAGQYLISGLDPNSLIYNIILYFIIVAFSEEWAKYIVLKLRTWKNAAFNCQFDGVVYSVFVGLGFALWENMQYVSMYGFETAIVRAVTAVPGHACFAVFMGVWYGMAKRYEYAGEKVKAKQARISCVVVPAILHGIYDFTATMGQGISLIFVIFVIAMFFWASKLVKEMSRNDKYIGFQGRDNY